ncbi:hypothetical protein LTR66_014826 [Elasticomyces elasticus]|nr:hypothetical protein LTR66_014826 [Elasticomyces elasticus]
MAPPEGDLRWTDRLAVPGVAGVSVTVWVTMAPLTVVTRTVVTGVGVHVEEGVCGGVVDDDGANTGAAVLATTGAVAVGVVELDVVDDGVVDSGIVDDRAVVEGDCDDDVIELASASSSYS